MRLGAGESCERWLHCCSTVQLQAQLAGCAATGEAAPETSLSLNAALCTVRSMLRERNTPGAEAAAASFEDFARGFDPRPTSEERAAAAEAFNAAARVLPVCPPQEFPKPLRRMLPCRHPSHPLPLVCWLSVTLIDADAARWPDSCPSCMQAAQDAKGMS